METQAWMIRAGAEGEREVQSLEEGKVFAGWPGLGDLSKCSDFQAVKEKLRVKFPGQNNHLYGNWAGQLNRFANLMKPGDIVLTPLKNTPGSFAIGYLKGEYEFSPDHQDEDFAHSRAIEWKQRDLSKSILRHDIRQSLNSLMTVSEINREDVVYRLRAVAEGAEDPGPKNCDSYTKESLEAALRGNDDTVTVTRRNLLEVLGFEKRTPSTIDEINIWVKSLGRDFTEEFSQEDNLDSTIELRKTSENVDEIPFYSEAAFENGVLKSPYKTKVRSIAENTELLSLKPEDSLTKAQYAMMINNYSQIPIIDKGAVKGVVTWETIASAWARGSLEEEKKGEIPISEVLLVDPPLANANHEILRVIGDIEEYGFTIAIDDESQPVGIVTAADIATLYHEEYAVISDVQEIEYTLKRLVEKQLSDDDIRAANCNGNKIDDMTMGGYPYLLSESGIWEKLDIGNFNRDEFIKDLRKVNKIRNDLFHQRRESVDSEAKFFLKRFGRMLTVMLGNR